MAKNDFDIDFDFEKEYGFNPQAILDSEYTDEDLDLSEFTEDDADARYGRKSDDFDDFDLDELDLDEDAGEDVREDYGYAEESEDDLQGLDFEDDEYPDDADLTADIDFSRRASFFGVPEKEAVRETDFEAVSYSEEEPAEAQEEFDAVLPEEDPVQEIPEEPVRRERRGGRGLKHDRERARPEREPVKLTVPPVLTKLVRLYFPSQEEISQRMTPTDGRRRRPSKRQIFKEFYLPTVILGLALVLMLSFIIGSVSNAIDVANHEKQLKEQQAQQESQAAEQLASEGKRLMEQAEILAQGYSYQEAVDLLDTYQGEMSQEMTAKRAEYINAKSLLVEHQDPTLIPNLSFHVLVADMARAVADEELGGQYNRNFVSTEEFSKILTQLYANNYVLVNFESFVSSNSVDGTTTNLFPGSIWLPEGKRPVMITETMVNYFEYMIDGNDDGVADSGGHGFASRLVVDSSGNIKAEYVDENNATQVGNYDLVPILEDFIAQHPDFSYKGARATLAVSGSEGIFGYRVQSASIANKGQDYYNEQVVAATQVVEALKAKGYRLACYSFDNKDYKNISAAMVLEDIQKWKSQIAPVIGELDTIVFARGGDIGDYTGGKFDVLHENGFRYMLKAAETPYTEVNSSFVRQSRLMVTGENMVAKSTMFTDYGLFDPNAVLNLSIRGNVPVG